MPDVPVLSRHPRPTRRDLDPRRPYAFLVEPERTADGLVEDVATIFLTNRQCPFRCVFCDLWKNTTMGRTPPGAAAEQVQWALGQLRFAPHVKLYNSGNFFDEQAIPRTDRPRIAELLHDRRTVIVECHPRLVDRRCLEFAALLSGDLQVAMGLETVDPAVLPRLDKDMTLEDFARAAGSLTAHGIPVRAFVLLPAPFQSLAQGIHWAMRSIEHAFTTGVECCSIVPLRADIGDSVGDARPTLRALETVHEHGLSQKRGRTLVDLWDIERLMECPKCGPQRARRLRDMNLTQRIPPPVVCDCGT